MHTYVILIRGINVGGKKNVPNRRDTRVNVLAFPKHA